MRIFKGDDTGGTLGKRLMINVHSKYDLTGCVVIFTYQGVTRKWDDVKDGDRLELFFSHNETMKMSVGTFNGVLFAIDAAGKYRTIDNTVKIEVTTNLRACYGADELDVTIGSTVSWDDIINKPFDGVQVDLSTDDRQLAALGTIIEKLGGTVKVGIALVALCAISSFGYTTDTHTNTFVRNGVTYAQRGGMNATTYVVTNIDMTASDVGAVDTNAVRDIIRDEIIPATNRLNQTLSNALDDKRDKSDLAVYEIVRTENTDWTWTSENKDLEAALNAAGTKVEYDGIRSWFATGTPEGWQMYDPDISHGPESTSVTITFWPNGVPEEPPFIPAIASRLRYMDETLDPSTNAVLAAVVTNGTGKVTEGDLMKLDANGRLVKATASDAPFSSDGDYVKPEILNSVADIANTAYETASRASADSELALIRIGNLSVAKQDTLPYPTNAIPANAIYDFTNAVLSVSVDFATKTELAAKRDLTNNVCRKTEFTEWICNPPRTEFGGVYSVRYDSEVKVYTLFDNGVGFEEIGSPTDDKMNLEFVGYCTATRSAVCTSNELFVTQSYVTNAVSEAKYVPSATDPTFSNAVLAVGIDTNTVAQIGELKQFFDGLPTGTVGTSLGGIILALLGAAAYLKKKTALLENDGKPTDQFATDLLEKQVANVKANTVSLAAVYSETATYAVGDAVTHDGKLYKCAVAITTAEAWTPAHWTETTVATLWNDADTTSYGGQN